MPIEVRPFVEEDLEFALTQTGREGWGATVELFRAALAHDPDGCFVAEVSGRPAGMITTTRYARTAWIGNLIVVPEQRRRGLGRRLMNHALEHLSNAGALPIRLEADPMGIELYRELGFVDEFESLRFQLARSAITPPDAAERFSAADLPTIAAFDAPHFGDDRSRLLNLFFESARAGYWVKEAGRIQGYAMVLPSASGVQLGPWVAAGRRAAEILLRTALAEFGYTTVVVGLPSTNHTGVALLESHGFHQTPSSLRMIRGEPAGAAVYTGMFAIANGAMG